MVELNEKSNIAAVSFVLRWIWTVLDLDGKKGSIRDFPLHMHSVLIKSAEITNEHIVYYTL